MEDEEQAQNQKEQGSDVARGEPYDEQRYPNWKHP